MTAWPCRVATGTITDVQNGISGRLVRRDVVSHILRRSLHASGRRVVSRTSEREDPTVESIRIDGIDRVVVRNYHPGLESSCMMDVARDVDAVIPSSCHATVLITSTGVDLPRSAQ
jgi:hypothetical protein